MKKFLAEIIAGLIPHKMTRNQWRGKLRYGLINMLRLRTRLKKIHNAPKDFLSVCAIAKNEGPYFKEWIDWHLKQGVDRFYIYDNDSTDNTYETLLPYINSGTVVYIPYPGYRRQLASYDDCLERVRELTRWLAFIDIDEFIVPQKNCTLREFLQDFEKFSAVEINWLVYGSGGEIHKRLDIPVMHRFKFHSVSEHILNRHVKSIVDPKRVYCMIGCHEAARITGKAADSHGNELKKSFRQRIPQHDIIRINHYAVRSKEEFTDKKLRGRASGRAKSVEDDYFTTFDLNDIKED